MIWFRCSLLCSDKWATLLSCFPIWTRRSELSCCTLVRAFTLSITGFSSESLTVPNKKWDTFPRNEKIALLLWRFPILYVNGSTALISSFKCCKCTLACVCWFLSTVCQSCKISHIDIDKFCWQEMSGKGYSSSCTSGKGTAQVCVHTASSRVTEPKE